jgi:hypothetical protein
MFRNGYCVGVVIDGRVNAEDAKAAEHNRKGNIPADCSGEAEVQSGWTL